MLKIVKKMNTTSILGLCNAMLLMVLALGAVICLPGMASATVVSLAEDSVANYIGVNIYAVGIGNVGTEAGNYMLKYETAPTTLISGFCIDPHYSNKDYSPYEVQSIPKGSAFEAAAWVLSQGYSPALAPAAQVAVWELTWDKQYNRGFNLKDGDFRLNDPNPDTSQLAADVKLIYDAALAGIAGSFDSSRYVIAHSPAALGASDYQDFIVPNPAFAAHPAPIPASVVLLGSGLFALGLLSRRKKTALGHREKK